MHEFCKEVAILFVLGFGAEALFFEQCRQSNLGSQRFQTV